MAAFRRLRRDIEVLGEALSPARLQQFQRAAFSLYVDATTIDEVTPLPSDLTAAGR